MEISAVVAVKNDYRYIRKCVEALIDQDFPQDQYETIIVDGMSTDGTWEILQDLKKKYPFLILLQNPKGNAAAGRNIGIKNSRGKYIAFIDSDAIAPKNWLRTGRDVIATVDAAGVGGPDLLPSDSTRKSKSIGIIMSSPFASGGGLNPSVQHIMSSEDRYAEHIPTCNLFLKKEIFDKIGYFDETFVKGQDLEFNTRLTMARYKLFHSSSISVVHYRKRHLHSFVRQIYKWAKAKAAIIKKHGLIKPAYLLPVFGIAAVIILFVGALLFDLMPIFILLFFLASITYLFLVAFESLRLSKKHKDGMLFLYGIFLFPIIHFSYTMGVCYGLLRKKIW